jgi:hypothetical protein
MSLCGDETEWYIPSHPNTPRPLGRDSSITAAATAGAKARAGYSTLVRHLVGGRLCARRAYNLRHNVRGDVLLRAPREIRRLHELAHWPPIPALTSRWFPNNNKLWRGR